jgi:hypothetical protein
MRKMMNNLNTKRSQSQWEDTIMCELIFWEAFEFGLIPKSFQMRPGSGKGIFEGVTGRLDVKDDVTVRNFPYRGHLRY